MRSHRLPFPARVLCGGLAVGAGLIAARIVWTGEVKAKGGTVELGRPAALVVGGVFAALAAGSGWAAVSDRGSE